MSEIEVVETWGKPGGSFRVIFVSRTLLIVVFFIIIIILQENRLTSATATQRAWR